MQSIYCNEENEFDCGYINIIDKTYNKYETRFQQNELKFNRFDPDLANNAKIHNSPQQQQQHFESDECFSLENKLKPEPKSVYAGVFIAKHTKQFRERLVVNGRYLHKCKWNDCHYETHSTHSIVQHIHLKHIGIKELKCAQHDCGKTFKCPNSLAEHQKDHLCGFRIDVNKYKHGKGLCSYYNIKKYIKRVRVNQQKQTINQYSYHCDWSDCHFSTLWSNGLIRHIHSQHICPNRDNTNTKLIHIH